MIKYRNASQEGQQRQNSPDVPSKTNRYKQVDFLGFNLFASALEELKVHDKSVVNTINQYSYCIARKDQVFKKALMNADVLLPDGVGITAAFTFLTGKKLKKIAGADLHRYLLNKLNQEGGSCFYLGASKNTLDKIAENIKAEYPSVRAGFYSPPYKNEFSDSDNQSMIAAINSFCPDVLFIGMTAPKQEKWAYGHKAAIDAKLICSIGAVFDFFAGTKKRPDKIWINLGLEWLGRLLKEPGRMWKRYLYFGPIFINMLLLIKLNRAVSRFLPFSGKQK